MTSQELDDPEVVQIHIAALPDRLIPYQSNGATPSKGIAVTWSECGPEVLQSDLDMSTQTLMPYAVQQEIQLRPLGPEDLPEVKRLCVDWFPIEYPDSWYKDITSNPKFYSLAATFENRIIGIVVAEIKTRSRCNREDADILAQYFPPRTQMAYILSLGVASDFRRNGIASLLLDNLLSYMTSVDRRDCKAVYLHVLSSNHAAIHFYEQRHFHMHCFLPYYYSIKGCPRDGYSYVLYINGGQPPWTFFDYLKYAGNALMSTQVCALPQRFMKTVAGWWRGIMGSASTSALDHRS